MTFTQTPPGKKNPFILDPEEIKQAPKKAAVDQQPKANPFVLDQADLQTVKKKDGTQKSGTESAPTILPEPGPSAEDINKAKVAFDNGRLTQADGALLSANDPANETGLVGLTPEAQKVYIDAHNGPKISDLTNQTYNILSTAIPASPDPNINAQRQQLLSSVKSGDQGAITTAKNYINTGIQKQIADIKQQATQSIPGNGFTAGGQSFFNPTPVQQAQIDALEKRQQEVTATLNDYAINAAANSKETQTQVRAEVSGAQRGFTPNLAAEDLGKQIEKINGGLPNPNGNIQYEQQKAGFNALIQNKKLKLNDLITSGVKTKNQTLLQQAAKEEQEIGLLQNKADNLLDQFPDVATTQVARAIGDEIAETHPRTMIISKNDVQESAQRIEDKFPGFLSKYGKYINTVAESEGDGILGMFKEGLVPKGGLTGGLGTGANELTYGSANFVSRLLGDEKTTQFSEAMKESPALKGTKFSGATPTKVVYDNTGKVFKEKENEDYGKLNFNSSTRFIGQSIPGLAEWIIAEEATGGLAGLAGASQAGKATAGLVGASYITGYDANHKLASTLIEDNSTIGEAKKALTANLLTLTTAGAFKLVGYSPTKFVQDAVTKSVAPDIIEALEANQWRQLPKNKLQEIIADKIIPKVRTFASETAKSVGQGGKVAAATVADQKVKDFVSEVINPQKANASTVDDNIKSFAQQALFMGLIGMPKAIVGGFTSPSIKDAFYEIGTRPDQYIERINAAAAAGEYTPEQANKMISIAKTMGQEVAKAQNETTNDGLPLAVQQKRDIAVANFRKRAAGALKEAGVDVSPEKVSTDADEQIKIIKSQNTHLPLEETEAFKTAVEVDKEGNQVGKPASVEQIQDGAKYRYLKNGRETTTSGTELLAHMPDSAEHVKAETVEQKVPESETIDNQEVKIENVPRETIEPPAVDPELLQKGKEAIEVADVEGKLSDITLKNAKENPEQFLKEVSDQANGITRDSEGNPVKSEIEGAEKAAIDQYGPEIVSAAKEIFPESISSPKIESNGKSSSQEQGGVSEKTGNQEVSNQAGSESKTQQEGNVKPEKGGESKAAPLSSKQVQVNETLDKIQKHNAMKTTSGEAGEPKRALLNEIRSSLPEGFTIDYNKGHISGLINENGNKVQARSAETNRTEKAFDKSGYRPETTEMVTNLVGDEVLSQGIAVRGSDGKYMSEKQLRSALKDIREGKDTVGAKALYDAVEGMHERGMIDVRLNETGQEVGVPIEEFNAAFKEPLKPLTDEEIGALHGEISEAEFNKLFDDTIDNETKNENENTETTTGEAEQPAPASADIGTEKTSDGSEDTGAGEKLRSEQEPPGTGETSEGIDEGPQATGVKKAVIEAEREAEGKSPIQNQLRRDFGDVLDTAKDLIRNNGSAYVTALKNSIDHFLRPLTAEETVALSLRKAELINERNSTAKDILDSIASGDIEKESVARMKMEQIAIERDNIDRIAVKTNYEKGLSLAINKLLIQEDYSAAQIIQRAKAESVNGEISAVQEAKFNDLAAKLEDAQKRLEEHQEHIAQLEAERKVKDIAKEVQKDKFKVKKEKILSERKSLIDQFKNEVKGGEGPQKQGIILSDKMVGIIAKLARNYVEDGVVTLQHVVTNIINDLKEHAPELNESDVRNAISGYGQPKKSTYSDLAKQMTELRKQAEILSKIEDIKAGRKIQSKDRKAKNPSSEEVKKLNQDLKDAMVESGIDPYQERALKAFKTRLENQREKLKEKFKTKDYQEETKRVFTKDKEADKLQTEVEGIKKDIRKEVKKIEQENRPKWLKRLDFLAKWRRAVLLSSATTLGKLASAAAERSIISPMEELVGTILHYVPGIREISKAAPREGGGINFAAEKLAAKVFTERNTLSEMKKELQGKSSLKLLYGKEPDLPETALDWFGRLHAALKAPAKLNEFERALRKREDFAVKNGFDIYDPVVKATIDTQAYQDANRAIFQQNNILSDNYTRFVEGLAQGSKSEKVTSNVLRMLLPIVKVPTNFVWESSSYAAGALKALPGIYKAIKHGVDKLEPNEADFVLRALKKQGLGVGMLALGYFGAGSVGGYYTGKRKEGDLEAGDVEMFGLHLPHFLLHAPLIEMLQIGATLRRVNDTYEAKGKDGEGPAAITATKGLFGQVPFFNTAGTLMKALENTNSAGSFAGEFVKSFVVPPTVQQAAKYFDKDEQGNEVERKAAGGGFINTATQHFETGVPGLRKNVPTKDEGVEINWQKKENEKLDKLGLTGDDRTEKYNSDEAAREERKQKKVEKAAEENQ